MALFSVVPTIALSAQRDLREIPFLVVMGLPSPTMHKKFWEISIFAKGNKIKRRQKLHSSCYTLASVFSPYSWLSISAFLFQTVATCFDFTILINDFSILHIPYIKR